MTIINRFQQRCHRHMLANIRQRTLHPISIFHNNFYQCNETIKSKKQFSTISRGHDFLAESLAHGSKRKIILDSYYPNTGIDVLGMIEYDDLEEENGGRAGDEDKPQHVLMNSSIIALPHSCFLWDVSTPKEVTLESLAIIRLIKPSIEYLFIGCDIPLPPRELNRIKKEMKNNDIVVEQLDVVNAMGTFNILNGEDRRVAVALIVDVQNE
mmetsp:Transcript_25487/g.31397  ORF Transcript_25487/g.31397 Transcript_25487/m.31397 type:complete len:211 (-) Transcript_25487:201-833(-)